ncbi:hypothetical protein AGR1A_Cc50394 [Agrobacterium fabacearum CFBP 5771]|nr:hypothetical protein AGR1A_Cc50394 [Agrobacterium fabacearum CFBP 5771]
MSDHPNLSSPYSGFAVDGLRDDETTP